MQQSGFRNEDVVGLFAHVASQRVEEWFTLWTGKPLGGTERTELTMAIWDVLTARQSDLKTSNAQLLLNRL